MTGFLLLAISAALLIAGAELFVEHVAGAARRLGVSVLAVGLLLAGAEPEELLTAVLAALRGHPGLAAGDAIGANVTMLTATLGLAALLRPLPVGRRVRGYAAISVAAGALAVATLADGRVARWEGALLLVGYAALVAVVWWREREPPAIGELAEAEAGGEQAARAPLLALLLALLGVAVMLAGGDLAVEGAERVLETLHARESAVGLTLLALATTAELFALVWAAARRGVEEVAVAGVVGSAAYNATATLGAAALARPLRVTGIGAPAVFAAALPLVAVVLARRGVLRRGPGALLVAAYAGYVTLLLR